MVRLLVSLAIASSALAVTVASQEPQVFRGASDTVRVFLTATDKANRIVTDLTREQFEVKDNGRPQPLTQFDSTPQPVRVIVLIDVSGSMAGNLNLMRAACQALFERLLPGDLARVGTFGNEIFISPRFTNDVRELLQALPTDINPGASTPLWRSMDQAMDLLRGEEGRPVLVVMSDAKDSMTGRFGEKLITQVDVSDRATREDVLVYGIGIHGRMPPGATMSGQSMMSVMTSTWPDPGLARIAEETGGGYTELRQGQDLRAAFARIADELHSQYLLGFSPPARDGKTHKIEVKTTAKDVKVRARRSYVAPKAAK
jgi:Ca-activated chloride channel family protein